jgi:hypothetical protein
MAASLSSVGNKLKKSGTISLKGIYATGSGQTVDSPGSTPISFGYRRIQDDGGTNEYAQVSPFDVVASQSGTPTTFAPDPDNTAYGGTTAGTQFYSLAQWDGYVHWQGSTSPYRERPTAFGFLTTDCDQGSNCCGTGTYTSSSSEYMWSSGCNPEGITFTWSKPTQPTDNPDYNSLFAQTLYIRECTGTNCTSPDTPASSSLRDVQRDFDYTVTSWRETTLNSEGSQYSATVITRWKDTGIGGTTTFYHSYPAAFTTPSGPNCTGCGASIYSPQEIYFQVGTCDDCTSMGTVYTSTGTIPAGLLAMSEAGTKYSNGATVFQNLTSGDCLFNGTTAGLVCTRCSGGALSGDWVAHTTSTSPCGGGTPYKLWAMNGGCLTGTHSCIGA